MPKKTKKKIVKEVKEKVVDSHKFVKRDYIFDLGRRKCSIARVRYYKKGEPQIMVNDRDYCQIYPYFEFQNIIKQPLELLGIKEFGCFTIKVAGGGKRGQAESIRLGIARILASLDPQWHKMLKAKGLLTRDSRVKERKKYGLKRARRAPQWQKR